MARQTAGIGYRDRALVYAAGQGRAARLGIPVTEATVQVLGEEYARRAEELAAAEWHPVAGVLQAAGRLLRRAAARRARR